MLVFIICRVSECSNWEFQSVMVEKYQEQGQKLKEFTYQLDENYSKSAKKKQLFEYRSCKMELAISS